MSQPHVVCKFCGRTLADHFRNPLPHLPFGTRPMAKTPCYGWAERFEPAAEPRTDDMRLLASAVTHVRDALADLGKLACEDEEYLALLDIAAGSLSRAGRKIDAAVEYLQSRESAK